MRARQNAHLGPDGPDLVEFPAIEPAASLQDFVNSGVGMFALGPYFNLLPLLTIGE